MSTSEYISTRHLNNTAALFLKKRCKAKSGIGDYSQNGFFLESSFFFNVLLELYSAVFVPGRSGEFPA